MLEQEEDQDCNEGNDGHTDDGQDGGTKALRHGVLMYDNHCKEDVEVALNHTQRADEGEDAAFRRGKEVAQGDLDQVTDGHRQGCKCGDHHNVGKLTVSVHQRREAPVGHGPHHVGQHRGDHIDGNSLALLFICIANHTSHDTDRRRDHGKVCAHEKVRQGQKQVARQLKGKIFLFSVKKIAAAI